MLVLYLSTISLEWKNIDSDLMQFVSKERRKKINQYFHVLDKKLSLYSALITRIGLSTISGLKHTELYFHILKITSRYFYLSLNMTSVFLIQMVL